MHQAAALVYAHTHSVHTSTHSNMYSAVNDRNTMLQTHTDAAIEQWFQLQARGTFEEEERKKEDDFIHEDKLRTGRSRALCTQR